MSLLYKHIYRGNGVIHCSSLLSLEYFNSGLSTRITKNGYMCYRFNKGMEHRVLKGYAYAFATSSSSDAVLPSNGNQNVKQNDGTTIFTKYNWLLKLLGYYGQEADRKSVV